MLAYIKRCQKSWAKVLEASNLLSHRDRNISKIIGLLDDALILLAQNLDLENQSISVESEDSYC